MNDRPAATDHIGAAPTRHIGTAPTRHIGTAPLHHNGTAPARDPGRTAAETPATGPWVGPDQWTAGDGRWVDAPAWRGGAQRSGVWRRGARRGGALRTAALLTTLTVLGVSGVVIALRAGGVDLAGGGGGIMSSSPLGGSAAEAGQRPADAGQRESDGVVQRGTGTFTSATGGTKRVGAGKVLRYRVEVEDGLGQDPGEFAGWVDRVLADRRGWTAGGQWGFQRGASAPTDFVVRLASPDTVDEICGRYGLDTQGEVSCRGGENVVINVRRWLLGIPAFNGDVDMYRHAVVNHEVGHFLGRDHRDCPGVGEPAPVMQPMIYGMNGCRPNGWPFPDAGDG